MHTKLRDRGRHLTRAEKCLCRRSTFARHLVVHRLDLGYFLPVVLSQILSRAALALTDCTTSRSPIKYSRRTLARGSIVLLDLPNRGEYPLNSLYNLRMAADDCCKAILAAGHLHAKSVLYMLKNVIRSSLSCFRRSTVAGAKTIQMFSRKEEEGKLTLLFVKTCDLSFFIALEIRKLLRSGLSRSFLGGGLSLYSLYLPVSLTPESLRSSLSGLPRISSSDRAIGAASAAAVGLSTRRENG